MYCILQLRTYVCSSIYTLYICTYCMYVCILIAPHYSIIHTYASIGSTTYSEDLRFFTALTVLDVHFLFLADPCSYDGVCSNTNGSFSCSCVPPYSGPLCQYNSSCDPNPCLDGFVCVETVTNAQRYVCSDTSDTDTLSLMVGIGVTDANLDMAVVHATLENPIPIADGVSELHSACM